MFFYFKVSSKDKSVLKNFSKFLKSLNVFPAVLKTFSKHKKRKFVTILKSPHVNKTAQEQFEFRYYTKEFLIDSLRAFTFFLIIKKVKNLSFPGLKLEVKAIIGSERKNRSFLSLIDPDNVILEQSGLKTCEKLSSQKKYVQLFDCYGELCLKELALDRSK